MKKTHKKTRIIELKRSFVRSENPPDVYARITNKVVIVLIPTWFIWHPSPFPSFPNIKWM